MQTSFLDSYLGVNLDSVVNLDDLHQWRQTPIDVDQSGRPC